MNKKYEIDFDDPRVQSGLDKLDIHELLEESGFEYSDDGRNISSENFIGLAPCPSCGDDRFHAAVNKEKYFISCFICKCYFHPLKTVAYLKHTSLKKAAKYLMELSDDIELDVEDRVRNILKGVYKEKKYSYRGTDHLPENKPITKKMIKFNKALHTFFKERRLKFYDIEKYDLRIGVGNERNKIIFPVYLDNELVSFQTRRIDRKQYHVPPNLSKYLLWEDELSGSVPILLVEGFLDAIHLRDFVDIFYPNKFKVTTGFTKSVSAEQLHILREKNPSKLICFFDGDAWHNYIRIKNELPFDVDFVILPKKSDPNSLMFKELNRIFKKEKLI